MPLPPGRMATGTWVGVVAPVFRMETLVIAGVGVVAPNSRVPAPSVEICQRKAGFRGSVTSTA